MDLQSERKLEVSEWVIRARWFYIPAIFLMVLFNRLLSGIDVNITFFRITVVLAVLAIINFLQYLLIKKIKKNKELYDKSLHLGAWQIIPEIICFAVIMHWSGGIENAAPIFFFILPIISSALISGVRTSIITAVISSIIINLIVIFEYSGVLPHYRGYSSNWYEYENLAISLSRTVTISFFYIIAGLFSGYGSGMIFERENVLENEAERLDNQTRMLVRRDIKLTETNNELVEEKDRINSIISNLTEPMLVLDKDNQLTLINPAAKKFLGINNESLGTKLENKNNFSIENFRKIIRAAFEIKEVIKQENESDDTIPIEEINIKGESSEYTYKIITARILSDEKEYLGVMKIFIDVSREAMIDKMKSEFISVAAHQLRTPLSAIKWVIKMVLDEDAGKISIEQRELLTKGYLSNERVINLVNDLLNVSRIEEGRFGFSFSEGDFIDVINAVIENCEKRIAQNHIKVVVDKPAKLPRFVMDSDRLMMAVENLLDNSLKYTPAHGRIKINLKVEKEFLRVSIKDNGVGIPKEDQDRLFSKFFRASNVVRMQTDGTGLGLFIVRNIIENHGGEMSVKSEEGMGTEISFTLNLKK